MHFPTSMTLNLCKFPKRLIAEPSLFTIFPSPYRFFVVVNQEIVVLFTGQLRYQSALLGLFVAALLQHGCIHSYLWNTMIAIIQEHDGYNFLHVLQIRINYQIVQSFWINLKIRKNHGWE